MKRLFVLMLAATLLLGCYPQGPEYVEDLDVVYTTFDKEYDFQANGGTYAMPDKIVVDAEKDDNGNWVPEYMAQPAADVILNAIEEKMTEYGWTRLPNDEAGVADPDADVVVTPAAIKSTTYFYSYWYDWYYGWYGGYWGWYYPPYYTVSSYTTGSLIIVMADPSNPLPAASWVAVGNGLYTGYYEVDRVTDAIDQAFAQSPYLDINP